MAWSCPRRRCRPHSGLVSSSLLLRLLLRLLLSLLGAKRLDVGPHPPVGGGEANAHARVVVVEHYVRPVAWVPSVWYCTTVWHYTASRMVVPCIRRLGTISMVLYYQSYGSTMYYVAWVPSV